MADENMRRDAGPGRDVGAGYGPPREPGVAVYNQGYAQPAYGPPMGRPGLLRRISWGAIFAGAVVAISVQLVLSMLGLAIGLATVDPTVEARPAEGLGTGAGIWWVVTGLISLFIGGWVAGRLAAFPRWIDAMLHGLVVWGLTAVATVFLLGSGVTGLLGGALGTVSQAAVSAAPAAADEFGEQDGSISRQAQQAWDRIRGEANQLMGGQGQQGRMTTGDPQVDRTLNQLLSDRVTEQDRTAAVNLLVNRADMSREEAQRTVDRWEQAYQDARYDGRLYGSPEQREAETPQTAENALDTATAAAVWAFFAMLLGAIAAAWGGAIGRPAVSGAADERVHHR